MSETPFTADPVPLDAAITAWEHQQAQVDHFIQQHFQEGSDYHIMKGKPSLGKAGAEKLATLFHLRPTFAQDTATRAMMGDEPGLLCYLCVLYTADNQVFAEGRGARRLASDPDDPNKTVKMAEKCLGGTTPVLVKSPQGITRTLLNKLFFDGTPQDKFLAGPDGTWRKIVHMAQQPSGPVKRLTFRDGFTVVASLDHRWPLLDGRLVATEALQVGDCVQRGPLPAGEGTADHDFAWMSGLFVAQGSKPNPRALRFSLHANKDGIAARLRRIAERLGATCSDVIKGNGRVITLYGASPVGIIDHFVEGRLSYGKHFRHQLFRQDRKVLAEALMGYLEGDGSFTVRPGRQPFWALGFTRHNHELAADLRAIAAMLGYRCILRPGTALETKTQKRFETYTGSLRCNEPLYNGANLGEITAIHHGNEVTYAIEVDGNHLFSLANGLVTHNSAMIDAVLRGLALSGRYTQDMEDAPAQPPVPPTAPVGTWRSVVPGEVYATALQKDTLPSGTIFYKVLSDDFPPRYSTGKYPGVVIWENGLKASGIDVEALQAGVIPDIAGWRVEWEEYKDKDGKDRQRVNRLVPVHQETASTDEGDDDIPF